MAVKLGMLTHDGTKADEGKGNEKKTTQFATPFGGKPEHRLVVHCFYVMHINLFAMPFSQASNSSSPCVFANISKFLMPPQ